MNSLPELLGVCENDTRAFVSQKAAKQLANWRNYHNEADLVAFIQRCIRPSDNRANGFLIHTNGGLSLESIVVTHRPDLFSPEDKQIASQTLGIT